MAKRIPIWPGSSSFATGQTPFGIYDAQSNFQTDIDKVADWCAKRLGFPIVDVELDSGSFYAAFEEAVSEYGAQVNSFNIRDNLINLYGSTSGSNNLSQRHVTPGFGGLIGLAEEYGTEAGSGGDLTYYTGSLTVSSSQQIYDLTDPNIVTLENGTPGTDTIEIKRVFHEAPPAIVKYFDPFVGTGLGTQQMLDGFGFGGFSPGVTFMMMPLYYDISRFQAIEFNDQIRKSAYSFELVNDRIKLFPIPDGSNFTKVYFHYIKKAERFNPLKEGSGTGRITDFSTIQYDYLQYSLINDVGRQWIRRYALALSKEMLGYVRGKYSSMPIPNAEITLNGSDLISAAQTEKEGLISELKEILDQTSRQAQLERKQAESDAMQATFNKMPLKIYIG